MRISDWSSDVCSSDLPVGRIGPVLQGAAAADHEMRAGRFDPVGRRLDQLDRARRDALAAVGLGARQHALAGQGEGHEHRPLADLPVELDGGPADAVAATADQVRSEEHTSELRSLMRISYAVFCLKTNNINQ